MVFDMATIAEAVTSLKTATDVLNSLKSLRGRSGPDKSLEEEITKLQGAISAAHSSAFAAQVEQFSMLKTIRDLEAKVAEFETWDSEKVRYDLVDVNPGFGSVYVYRLKREAARGEIVHCICPKCYGHRIKSILQGTHELKLRRRVHECPECKSTYLFGNVAEPAPDKPAKAITEYDPFATDGSY
jgi:hypothetical protein